MVQITKAEALELNKNGVPWHENGISRTYSKHKHYYLCTSPRNMSLLNKIRNAKKEA